MRRAAKAQQVIAQTESAWQHCVDCESGRSTQGSSVGRQCDRPTLPNTAQVCRLSRLSASSLSCPKGSDVLKHALMTAAVVPVRDDERAHLPPLKGRAAAGALRCDRPAPRPAGPPGSRPRPDPRRTRSPAPRSRCSAGLPESPAPESDLAEPQLECPCVPKSENVNASSCRTAPSPTFSARLRPDVVVGCNSTGTSPVHTPTWLSSSSLGAKGLASTELLRGCHQSGLSARADRRPCLGAGASLCCG